MYAGRGNHFGLAAIARLKPGVDPETANAEMVAIARQLEQEYPNTNSGNSASARPLFETLIGTARPMLYVLFGAVITMLLIACVNLANLMLSRAAGRAQEMAVRRSLGAARWRIARQMLTESLLLAIIGGIAGVALAYAGFEALVALLPPNQPRIHVIAIDLRVLLMAAAASIGTGILFGLMPAIQAATGRSMTLLRSSRVTGSAQRQRRHQAHADARRSRARARARHRRRPDAADDEQPGVRSIPASATSRSSPAQFNLPSALRRHEKRLLFLDQALERLRAIPGVTKAAFTYSIPVAGSNWNSIFIVEGQPVPKRNQLPSSAWIPISNGLLRHDGHPPAERALVRQPRCHGRAESCGRQRDLRASFLRRQRPDRRAREAGLARRYGAPWRQIVGVVNDTRMNSLQGDPTLQGYLPVRQVGQRSGAFVLRTDGNRRNARPLDRGRDSRDRSEPAAVQHPDDERSDRCRDRQRAFDDGAADRLCGARAADGGDRRVRRHRRTRSRNAPTSSASAWRSAPTAAACWRWCCGRKWAPA